MFDVEATATDASGGAGIRRLELYADGRFVRSFGDGVARISPWWNSRYWKRGRHELTFKAEDEAGNKVTRTVTVDKVRRLPKVRTASALTLSRVDRSTVRVSGGVTAGAAATTQLRGKAVVRFQQRARRHWRTVRKVRRSAGRPFTVQQRLRPGAYRVFLRYPGVEGFKRSRSQPVRFRIG